MTKELDFKLISELMKNSRRSDREISKALGISQPTVTRLRTKLEREGLIKEYTIIPDFIKLGYNIMGITLIKRTEPSDLKKSAETRKVSTETERQYPHAMLMAVNGAGLGKDSAIINFYESYSDYLKAMELARNIPNIEVREVETFMVDLNDKSNYRLLSMAAIAHHISLKKAEKQSKEKKRRRKRTTIFTP